MEKNTRGGLLQGLRVFVRDREQRITNFVDITAVGDAYRDANRTRRSP